MENEKKILSSFQPLSTAELVPHAAPMLLLGELTAYAPEYAAGVSNGSLAEIFANAAGEIDPVVLVEMAGQLTAAKKGFERQRDNLPLPQGMLVGIRNFTILERITTDDTLTLECQRTFAIEQASIIEATVSRGETLLASGELKIWETETQDAPTSEATSAKDNNNRPIPRRTERSFVFQGIVDAIVSADHEADETIATLRFHLDFPAFRGHFPERPILPGVVMLQTGLILGSLRLGSPLRLVSVDRAKFSSIVMPGDLIEARLKIKTDENGYRIIVRLAADGRPVAKFTLGARA